MVPFASYVKRVLQLDIFSVCVTANQPLEATENLQSNICGCVDSYERWFDYFYSFFERRRA